jgi:RNA polymerase-binding transcription factor DksA
MTKTELSRFQAILNARIIELEQLIRYRDDSFGKCQKCHEDIHPKRLGAAPWSPFYIRCQEAFDRNPEEMQTQPRDLLPSKTLEYLL